MDDILIMCAKALGFYFLILISLRFLGKKGLSGASLGDIVIVVLIGTPLGPNLPENNKYPAALSAIVCITLANYIIDWLIFKNEKIRHFFEGEPSTLVKDGKYIQRNMIKERVPKSSIEKAMRKYGLQSIEDIKLAVLETDGQISIIEKRTKT